MNLLLFSPSKTCWADIVGSLVVTVVRQSDEKPMSGVQVTVQDLNSAHSPVVLFNDETGMAHFSDLPIGSYSVQAEKSGWVPEVGSAVIREHSTTEMTLYLAKPGEESVLRVNAKRLLMNAQDTNGSSTYKNRTFMETRMANDHSLQQVANLSPGVTLDSQGLLHFRGEHRSMSIAIDGVVLPIPLQSQIGSLVDPRFLEEVEVRTGSYDPTFGGQLGGVLNLVSRAAGAKPISGFETEVGDHGILGGFAYAAGSEIEHRLNYFFGAQSRHTNLRLEAPYPTQQGLNNQGDDTNSFAHLTYIDGMDRLNLAAATQNLRTNLPNTPSAQAVNVNQWQRENNLLGVFSWRRQFSPKTQMLFGLSFLGSHQGVGNNGVFTPWVPANPATLPHAFANQLPANSEDSGSPFLPSLSRSGFQKLVQLEFTHELSASNALWFGGAANFIHLGDSIDITDAGGAGTLPNGVSRYTALDNRDGFDGGMYVADFVKLTPKLNANMGLRLDRYNNGLNVSTMQVSPLFNFAYALSPTQALRWSIDRLFSAPPLEPDPTGNTHVIPQKTSAYELSYELQPERNLVVRIGGYLKNYRDTLDLALLVPLSNLPVFVPVNFPSGQTAGVELSLNTDQPFGFNWFFNVSGTSMHILAPSPGTAQIPLVDHFENVLSTFGVSYQWKNGFYASADNKYGSGFPQDAIKAYNADGVFPFGIHGTTSRFIGNFNVGYRSTSDIDASLEVLNVFNSRRILNLLSNFSGTRFVKERQVLFNLHAHF